MVHLIFSTKYRRSLFMGRFKDDVKQYIYDACVKKHWYIKKMETDKDHIHILLQYNPTDSISRIVSYLKQVSTWYAWQNHSEILKKQYWKEHTLWSDGYFAASTGQVSEAIIQRYIESQG